jgi:TPR repeat protein
MRWWRTAVVDPKAELIRWWNIIDCLMDNDLSAMLEHAFGFASRHKDALWLNSVLFSVEGQMTYELLNELMMEQDHDPRALFFRAFSWDKDAVVDGDEWEDRYDNGTGLLRFAADMGYAPAQSALAFRGEMQDQESFDWASKAAAQGDRHGVSRLARCYELGLGCEKDENKAMQLFKEAADLEDDVALFKYGEWAFDEDDPRRYSYMGRAAARGYRLGYMSLLGAAVAKRDRRIQFEVGAANRRVFKNGWTFGPGNSTELQREAYRDALAKYRRCCDAAKAAVECWLVVGRRLRVAKDIRGVIGKLLWEQRWEWMEKDAPAAPEEDAAKRPRVE